MITIAWIVLNKNLNPAKASAIADGQLPIYYKRRIAQSWASVLGEGYHAERVMISKTCLPVSFTKGKAAAQKKTFGGGARNAGSSLRKGANYERTPKANFKKKKS